MVLNKLGYYNSILDIKYPFLIICTLAVSGKILFWLFGHFISSSKRSMALVTSNKSFFLYLQFILKLLFLWYDSSLWLDLGPSFLLKIFFLLEKLNFGIKLFKHISRNKIKA